MLDKRITYIVCWHNTLYQVLPIAWTNRIIIPRFRDSTLLSPDYGLVFLNYYHHDYGLVFLHYYHRTMI
jgi:hypothetical protein